MGGIWIFKTPAAAQRKLDELRGWGDAHICHFEIIGFGPRGYVIARLSRDNPPHFLSKGLEDQ